MTRPSLVLCDGRLAPSRHGDWPQGAPLPSHLPREHNGQDEGPGRLRDHPPKPLPPATQWGPPNPRAGAGVPTASHSHTRPPTSAVASSEQGRAPCRQEDGPKCSRGSKCPGEASALTVPSSLGPENKPPDKEVWVPAVWPPQWGRGLPHSTQPGARQVRGAQRTWPGGLRSQQ